MDVLQEVIYTGFPTPWFEASKPEGGIKIHRILPNTNPQWAAQGLTGVRLYNPMFPIIVLMLAVVLPFILVDGVFTRSSSRRMRLARVAGFAAAFSLLFTIVEFESSREFRRTPTQLSSWTKPVWDSPVGNEFRNQLDRSRHWLDDQTSLVTLVPVWELRTLVTLVAFLSGLAVGAVLFKPWRHAIRVPDLASGPA